MRRIQPLYLLFALGMLAHSGCRTTDERFDYDKDGVDDWDDCEPQDPDIYPGNYDPYGDGIDQDCDDCGPGSPLGAGDGVDKDCDGYPLFDPEDTSGFEDWDCNDDDEEIHPGAELPENDCEDDNCTDEDQDDACVEDDCDDHDAALNLDDEDGDGHTTCDGDCDDEEATTWPGAPELCDGVDNDCDGDTDEDPELYMDQDQDGYTPCEGDCDDTDILFSPDMTDICDDGLDNNCDGLVDINCITCTTWVPANYATVQAAIENASEDDVVCVSPGTYMETLDMGYMGLHLLGVAGPIHTIIDGDGAGTVLDFPDGAMPDQITEGFTVTGGDAPNGGGIHAALGAPTLRRLIVTGNSASNGGGGIYMSTIGSTVTDVEICDNSTGGDGGGMYLADNTGAVFTDVTVEGNWAGGRGGGAYVDDSVPVFEHCLLADNTATADGGGLYLDAYSNPELVDVSVTGNDALNGGGIHFFWAQGFLNHLWVTGNTAVTGGGIYMEQQSEPQLRNLVLSDNHADDGGGLYAFYSHPVIDHALITGNTATGSGGGLAITQTADPVVTNAIISGNTASGYWGGGVFVSLQSHPDLIHCILTGNTAANGGGIAAISYGYPDLINSSVTGNQATSSGGGIWVGSATADVLYSNVQGNTPDNYSGMDDPTGTNGNISVDPQYLDTSNPDPADWDLHLSTASALIGAGDPSLLDPDNSPADMGVYGGPDADTRDLDHDDYPDWWLPGPYDAATSPGADCDDLDDTVFAGQGC